MNELHLRAIARQKRRTTRDAVETCTFMVSEAVIRKLPVAKNCRASNTCSTTGKAQLRRVGWLSSLSTRDIMYSTPCRRNVISPAAAHRSVVPAGSRGRGKHADEQVNAVRHEAGASGAFVSRPPCWIRKLRAS